MYYILILTQILLLYITAEVEKERVQLEMDDNLLDDLLKKQEEEDKVKLLILLLSCLFLIIYYISILSLPTTNVCPFSFFHFLSFSLFSSSFHSP